jgi:NADH-quinone oxidoreductase subunit J
MLAYLFYGLGLLAIFSALMVILSKSPVYSVLFLILTFFAITGEYVLLNAQFLAIVNLIVYAGAIMVLFLFVLMLLNLNSDSEPQKSIGVKALGLLTGGLMFIAFIGMIKGIHMDPASIQYNPELGLVANLGKMLFTDYVVPFEISSILFLSAMVGAVMIGKRDKMDSIV